ncbi:MAG: glycosyltransferase family 4 protein [Desulfohalobiaceae bacterium]|nr:glycosyltransferase family 4 protein [Desulfohalobiaceae bacterium]
MQDSLNTASFERNFRVGVVGPFPPPWDGMGNQTAQLVRLLRSEGIQTDTVRINEPYCPVWISRLRGVRALFRLIPYMSRLWKLAKKAEVVHVIANSGWSWYLFAAPAIWVASIRRCPVVLHYRGGRADQFLKKNITLVRPALQRVHTLVVPSSFLQKVFADNGVKARVIPNVIDIGRFRPKGVNKPEHSGPQPTCEDCGQKEDTGLQSPSANSGPHIIVTRKLEPVYDIETVIRAFDLIRQEKQSARLTIAGKGPEKVKLQHLVQELGLSGSVFFAGEISSQEIAELYDRADLMLNASRVDNMPNSILEALASHVPVVSTNAGGIPYMVSDEEHALLAPVQDYEALAEKSLRVLNNIELREKLLVNGFKLVNQCTWDEVKKQLFHEYHAAIAGGHPCGGLKTCV